MSVGSADDAEASAVVADHGVGGLFLRGRSTGILGGGALEALRASSPAGLLVAVDEEGGRVERTEAFGEPLPSAREMAATMTPAEVERAAAELGAAMRATGVDLDLAPVVDVSSQPDGAVIGDRSFSDDPEVVATYAEAFARGLRSEGVTPVLKHFPGHGRADGDSHDGPVTTPPLEALRGTDLVPYRDVPAGTAVMVGHLDVPGLTEPGVPASLSPAAIGGLLRDDLGFDGIVITDDLSDMGAVTDRLEPGVAAAQSIAAGADLALLRAEDLPAALEQLGVAVANGSLPAAQVDRSVLRTLEVKGVDPCNVRWSAG